LREYEIDNQGIFLARDSQGKAMLMGFMQGGWDAVAMLKQLDRTLLFEFPAKLV